MSEHTPGPWAVAPTLKQEIIHPKLGIIAIPCSNHGISAPPNARLIAAAPQMLEALEIVEKALHDTQHYPWEIVRAAIKAARGE
jgi:hypothetical protein